MSSYLRAGDLDDEDSAPNPDTKDVQLYFKSFKGQKSREWQLKFAEDILTLCLIHIQSIGERINNFSFGRLSITCSRNG